MNAAKRKTLESRGWKFGDAAVFLGMDEQERRLLELRMQLAMAARRQRQISGLTRADVARRLGTSRAGLAKIEQAAPDVSIDQIVKAVLAAGGRITVKGGSKAAAVDLVTGRGNHTPRARRGKTA